MRAPDNQVNPGILRGKIPDIERRARTSVAMPSGTGGASAGSRWLTTAAANARPAGPRYQL